MKIVEDSLELLRDMVRIPSESFSEQEVSNRICESLDAWGIKYTRIGVNILAFNKLYDASKPTLALDAHIDTVPAAASYTRNPLEPGDDPSVIYGLGSNDDGGSVVAMIAAFRHYYAAEMPINLALVLSGEEERSGPDGAIRIYGEDGPEQAKGIKWVILGEPTCMRCATGERGLLVLDGMARGVTGHAARGDGENALYKAIEDIQKLRAHKFSRISPTMGEVRLNVTQINAGTVHNVIPDSCSFVVDIRPTEQYSPAGIVEELQRECSCELRPRSLRNLSSATFKDSPLEKTARRMGMECFSSPTTSNWTRIGRHRDAVKMGPGDSMRSHHADEYIFSKEIEDAVEKYINFIALFYGNTLE